MATAFLVRVPVRIHTFTGLIFPWRSGLLRFVLKTTDRLTCLFATIVNPEGEGNSLLEAAATALPCITYDICGCNDSVDAETGILVPPYDADSLEKAMEELAQDPGKCRRLGAAGRRRMQENFSRAAVWGALRRFYAKVSAGA